MQSAADVTWCQSRQREMTVGHRDAEEERGNDETRGVAMKPNFHTNCMESPINDF